MLIVDARFVEKAKELWGDKYEIVPSFTHEKLQKPVSSHPDMTILPVGDVFVCCPESYEYYKEFLGERLISGKTALSSHYPNDIAYNVLIYKNKAFGKKDYIDSVVLKELKKRDIELVNVNQGYAKCSCAMCSNGVITADGSIFEALRKNGINSLKITPGYVKLTGYDYGFIGGASGVIDGKLTFFGDVSKHPDFLKIKEFCNFDYFGEFCLSDIGTIFCI